MINEQEPVNVEKRYNSRTLLLFIESVFGKIGLSPGDASMAAEVLTAADLRGIDSHGIARLAGYVRLWEKGRVNASPNIRIVHETPTTAVVDGDRGLGLVVAPRVMEIAMEKAEKFGSGWVSVKNSNHFGIAGYHALMAAEKEMIGIAMTNASPLVSPAFSKERLLGTNPMAFVFPAGKYPPVVIDMATAAAANGKLEIAQRENKKIPEGWLQDKEGNSSVDPFELQKGGALLPLGSTPDRGSHKGYGLGAAVDILSAVLSGANFGPWVPPFVSFLEPPAHPVGEGIGHFLGAMRIDGFRPVSEFKRNMDIWIERFKEAKSVSPSQGVIIPGEPELEMEKVRKKEGIPLLPAVIEDLKSLSERFGVPFEV